MQSIDLEPNTLLFHLSASQVGWPEGVLLLAWLGVLGSIPKWNILAYYVVCI